VVKFDVELTYEDSVHNSPEDTEDGRSKDEVMGNRHFEVSGVVECRCISCILQVEL
jgi:hypothetical protein